MPAKQGTLGRLQTLETKRTMNKNDFFIKTQVEADFGRVNELINTGVFSASVLRVFQESVFTEVMIKLNDLLQKLNLLKERVSFTDDVDSGDITDLVSNIRNAVCHMESGEHKLKDQQIKFTFNIAYGKVNLMSIGEKKLTSDYQDDICFFFGENKIYLKRHIIRCIQESKNKIQALYDGQNR